MEKKNLPRDYEDWKDEKAERREKKKIKKMPVHSSGLYDIWKMKMEKTEKKGDSVKKKD